MKALADGGFQVEELARLQYPHGVMIEVPYGNYQQAVVEDWNTEPAGSELM